MIVSSLSGLFGPYFSITEHSDRLEVDGATLPISVIGSYAILDIVPPDDFTSGGYEYVNGALIKKPESAKVLAEKAAQLITSVTDSVQKRLDAFAQTRNYDSILSACTYATSAVPKFLSEGQTAVNLRDQTWAALYTIMAEVQAGTRPMPTSFADVEPLLPALAWPI